MRIWMLHCYGTLPQHGQMVRHYCFGKYLTRLGHEPIVFVGSHPHNSTLQLISDKRPYELFQEKPFPWVLVKTNAYGNNKQKRLIAMFEYYFNTKRAVKQFGKPDVIIGSSNYPLVAYLGIRLAKKYNAKSVVEIRDLWPESLVAYGIISKNSLLCKAMRKFEKHLYKKADEIIFTMEGGYDYIRDQGWDDEIPRDKVHFINNGVDIEQYDHDCQNETLLDDDLEDKGTYKVVYTGSLRHANSQILRLIDVAEEFKKRGINDIKFLLYGAGPLVEEINERCKDKQLDNIILKGVVEKKYIPYILSKCDLNILNLESHDILKYGGSQNKMFDYLASGHPTITGDTGKYSIIAREKCGIAGEFKSTADIVSSILEMKDHGPDISHIRNVALKYDYRNLTKQLLDVIN